MGAAAGAGGAGSALARIAAKTGLLFGVQSGLRTEIFTSFEAKIDVNAANQTLKLDGGFLTRMTRLSACPAQLRRCTLGSPRAAHGH